MKNLNRKLLIALGVFLYLYSIMIYGLSSNATTFLLKDWGVVIGVSIIIIMAMNNLKVKAILNRGVFVYLGKFHIVSIYVIFQSRWYSLNFCMQRYPPFFFLSYVLQRQYFVLYYRII